MKTELIKDFINEVAQDPKAWLENPEKELQELLNSLEGEKECEVCHGDKSKCGIQVCPNAQNWTNQEQKECDPLMKKIADHLGAGKPKFNNGICGDTCNCIDIAEWENGGEGVKQSACLGGEQPKESGEAEKNYFLSILNKRKEDAFSDGFHHYERQRLLEAVEYIKRLVPSSYFESSQQVEPKKRINDILLDMQVGKICIGEAANLLSSMVTDEDIEREFDFQQEVESEDHCIKGIIVFDGKGNEHVAYYTKKAVRLVEINKMHDWEKCS